MFLMPVLAYKVDTVIVDYLLRSIFIFYRELISTLTMRSGAKGRRRGSRLSTDILRTGTSTEKKTKNKKTLPNTVTRDRFTS